MTDTREKSGPGNGAEASYPLLVQGKNAGEDFAGKKQCKITAGVLKSMLKAGPRPEQDVWAAVQQAGCSKRTYHRVRQALGVEANHVGGTKGWWELSLVALPGGGE